MASNKKITAYDVLRYVKANSIIAKNRNDPAYKAHRDLYYKYFKDDKHLYFAESIDEFADKIGYKRLQQYFKPTVHWGQFKLFVSELQAYSKYYKQLGAHPEMIVYAGAADGQHWCYLWPIISKINAQIQVFLIDPSKFHQSAIAQGKIIKHDEIANTDQPGIYFINSFYTDETSKLFKAKNKKVLFISDIRTGDIANETDKVQREITIYKDMLMQEGWVLAIMPEMAYLKFHVPYYEQNSYPRWSQEFKDNCRQVENGIEVKLFKAWKIFIQAYAGRTSTELRLCLFPTQSIEYDWYNFAHYEDTMQAWNIYRQASCVFLSNSPWLIENIDSYLSKHVFNEFTGLFHVNVDVVEFCSAMGSDWSRKYKKIIDTWNKFN
jgi:hypothetical protein